MIRVAALALTKTDPSLLKQSDPFSAHLFAKVFKFNRDARGGMFSDKVLRRVLRRRQRWGGVIFDGRRS